MAKPDPVASSVTIVNTFLTAVSYISEKSSSPRAYPPHKARTTTSTSRTRFCRSANLFASRYSSSLCNLRFDPHLGKKDSWSVNLQTIADIFKTSDVVERWRLMARQPALYYG